MISYTGKHSGRYGITVGGRDLKLENLLMDREGFIKLADFGLAKLVSGEKNKIKMEEDGEHSGYLCGTYEYMSPEILKYKEYNFNSDLWSFGVLLFEMLAGEVSSFTENLSIIYPIDSLLGFE